MVNHGPLCLLALTVAGTMMMTSCAAILGDDEGTDAVLAEPCDGGVDGGVELKTSQGYKCLPRIKLGDPDQPPMDPPSGASDATPGG